MPDDPTDPLSTKYRGATAEEYHDARADTPRRKAELAALDAYFARISPRTMLDIPCGTGSLFEAYHRHGTPELLGIDISEDMLAVAAGTEVGRSPSVTLRSGSVFDDDLLRSLEPVDLVCCIRFLNWISQDQADHVVRSLRPLATRWMIIGVTMAPADRSPLAKVKGQLVTARRARKARKGGTAVKTVHQEQWFRSLVADLGLTILDARQTMANDVRENHLFLLDADA